MISRRRALAAAILAASGLEIGTVRAAGKSLLRIISSGAPGSVSDMLARPLATSLASGDRTTLVDNRPGAGGFLAIAELMRSPADGNTLMLISASTTRWNKYLYKKLPYDPADIVPVSPMAAIPMMLVVRPGFPGSSVKDFVDAARKEPGRLTYGFGGNGGAAHVSFARFASAAGIDVTPVAYKSGPPALQDLMGGQIDSMLDGVPLLEPQVKAGKLKALAVATKSRLPSLPNLPTIAESGYPDFEAVIWVGIGAKRGTPAEILKTLNAEISTALRTPAVQHAYASAGALVRQTGLREFTEFVQAEDQIWGPILKKAAIVID
jgi:tripartite-type tricarboxylate transporter receptor subunit TctC